MEYKENTGGISLFFTISLGETRTNYVRMPKVVTDVIFCSIAFFF